MNQPYIQFLVVFLMAIGLYLPQGICQLGLPPIEVENMTELNSSNCNEILPVLSRNGRTLYFTRQGCQDFDKTLMIYDTDLYDSLSIHDYIETLSYIYSKIAKRPVIDITHSVFNQDIWVANLDDDFSLRGIEHPSYPLNSALPNSLCAITPDTNTYIILNQFSTDGGMSPGFSYIHKDEDGEWLFPEPFEVSGFEIEGGKVNLNLSADGEVMIISMDRADSRGQHDLYMSFRIDVGVWSSPVSLGNELNTSFNEVNPFLSYDKKQLYFASDRPKGYGGYDIYVSKRLDDTWRSWSTPLELVRPINSTADDGQPFYSYVSGKLYFSSRRNGSNDIYRVQIAEPLAEYIEVNGRVIDFESYQLTSADILYRDDIGESYHQVTSTTEGEFSVKVPRGKKAEIVAKKDGHISSIATLEFSEGSYYFEKYNIALELKKIGKEAKIELNPIYFEQSKAKILEKSYPELDRLAAFLTQNPTVKIRIEGHTDANGSLEDLQLLSEYRAKAIQRYLIDNGVDSNRLETLGLGANRTIAPNETEEERSLNRRVEIYITES